MIRKGPIILLLLVLFMYPLYSVYSETIILKSGEEIEAEIIDKTDELIKIDFRGVTLTYYLDDIEDIVVRETARKQPAPFIGISSPRKNNPGKKCFLWRFTSGSSRIYILGSIHYVNKDIYPLDEKIEEAFSQSDILVLEAKIDQETVLKGQLSMVEYAMYSMGDNLKQHVSGEVYDFVVRKLEEFSLPIELFGMYRPWFLAQLITSMQLQSWGYLPEYGIDMYFMRKARGRKEILELESLQFQASLLSNFSDRYQELFLYNTLLELDRAKEYMPRLVNAWSLGDTGTLESILLRSLKEDPQLSVVYDKIIYERNRNMAGKIEEFIRTGRDYFIVVGAGHLVGEEGIIELLRRKGYDVEQL